MVMETNKKGATNIKNSLSGTDHLLEHSLTQKELQYLCNDGGKTTPSYVDSDIDPDLEV
ncbi:MAG: hypothetical protein ACM3PA_01415 [Methanomassiliicoccales archaeon]